MDQPTRRLLVAPSLLACDFTRLGEEISAVEAAGADWLHLDVMDGQFVPNISFGPVIVEAARRVSRLPLDVQLMIEHPERYVEAFVKVGADHLTMHVEAEGFKDTQVLRQVLRDLRTQRVRVGLSVRPGTPAEALEPYLREVDQLLVMTVEPGFGGQAFMPAMLEKVRALRKQIDKAHLNCELQVDGGINRQSAPLAAAAGATSLVAGSAVLGASDPAQAFGDLEKLIQ